jgi:hypothetical protein
LLLFRIVRNDSSSGTKARLAAEALQSRLPAGWDVRFQSTRGANSLLTLRAPDGRRATLTVISRKQLLPKDIAHLLAQARDPTARMLVAPFLSARTRELLTAANASYVDATGNLRIVVNEPAVFIETQGAARDPDRQPRPLRSLKGAAAARVVRALCDFAPPYRVRTLADRSGSPLGTVSRVVTFLEQEALIERDAKKTITAVDWPALINRWVADYSVTGSNVLHSYIEPRGINALAPKLAKLSRYAATGSLAVPGSSAPARLAMIYVEDAKKAAAALELVPADAGANVWILEPYDAVVFERTQSVPSAAGASIVAAAPSQVVADLKTSPGRGPQEAEALIERLKGSEDAWRRKP